jgi:hypothetical protein
MESRVAALITAKPGHLRDSLQVLLAVISPIEKTYSGDNQGGTIVRRTGGRDDLPSRESVLCMP